MIRKPVVVSGTVRAYVIGSNSLTDVFENDVDPIYVVDSKGITELVYENGGWAPAAPE